MVGPGDRDVLPGSISLLQEAIVVLYFLGWVVEHMVLTHNVGVVVLRVIHYVLFTHPADPREAHCASRLR